MNKKIIISIILILILIILVIVFIPKWKGKSIDMNEIKENISIFDFELSDEDMKQIYNINENRRYENW